MILIRCGARANILVCYGIRLFSVCTMINQLFMLIVFKKVFGSVVAVAFQIIFCSKILQDNFF
jgi:hypothetical protein